MTQQLSWLAQIERFALTPLLDHGTPLSAVGVALLALWGLYGPAAMGLMTRRVGAEDQGKLQGANSSLNGIAGMAAPLVFTATFAAFIDTGQHWQLPGAAFLLAAAMLLGAWLLTVRMTRAA